MLRPALVSSAAVLIAAVVTATVAAAHVAADPVAAPAGTTQTIGFTVEHGCGESDTVSLAVQLPEGVSSATPQPVPGWEADVGGNVVTFSGGPLDHHAALRFPVSMDLPDRAGDTLFFPVVQRCQEGEIRWINIPAPGATAEPEDPAPAVELTPGPATATSGASSAPATSPPGATSSAVTTASSATTSSVTATSTPTTAGDAPAQSAAPASTEAASAPAASGSSGDGDASGGLIAAGVALVVAAGAAVIVFLVRRGRSA